jgi:hypothetical protein
MLQVRSFGKACQATRSILITTGLYGKGSPGLPFETIYTSRRLRHFDSGREAWVKMKRDPWVETNGVMI